MAVDASDRIIDFLEKPADPPAMPGKPDMALVSMGVYVFRTKFLFDQLRRDAATTESSRDFGKDIIPWLVKNAKAVAHRFDDSCVRSSSEKAAYWRDVGTVDAYWEANIDLTDVVPELDLYDRTWPLWTYAEISPPAKFVHDVDGRRGMAISSLVSGDCIVSGAMVQRSLLFTGVRAHSYSSLEEAVVLPRCQIGRGARLRRVVVDRGVNIPAGLVVGEDAALDASRFRRTDNGVCLITQAMIDRAGMIQVLSVASEAFPLVKTGGLGDVVGSLPGALAGHDITVTTLLPGYPAVRAAIGAAPFVHRYADLMGAAGADPVRLAERPSPAGAGRAGPVRPRRRPLWRRQRQGLARQLAALRRPGAGGAPILPPARSRTGISIFCMPMTGRRAWRRPICALRRARAHARPAS